MDGISYGIVAVLKNSEGPTAYVRTNRDALPVAEIAYLLLFRGNRRLGIDRLGRGLRGRTIFIFGNFLHNGRGTLLTNLAGWIVDPALRECEFAAAITRFGIEFV